MTDQQSTPQRYLAVKAAAASWAGQLIDLGGRNSLLYYRDLKVGTLDLTAADPIALKSLLDGRATKLSKLFSPSQLTEASRRCRTVSAKAKENFEERGLSTLYLARGMATWTADGATSSTPSAPVFLAQVSLKPVGALQSDFELTLTDDWEPNPTLLHMLASSFQLSISPDELIDELERRGDIESLNALVRRAQSVPGFDIRPRTVVGNFSYAKQPMVVDLETATDVMAASDVVAALAGDREAIASLRSASIGVGLDQPDRTLPSNEFLVIDADSSQNYVINAAIHGTHLVVQGPPGTGKSQTIANLIASLSAVGRSVLFVAEKRAAIDAVVNRLNRVGLRDLVLDLHGGGASRKRMAEELRRVYDGNATVPAVVRPNDDARLSDRREKLNRHSQALHAPRDPWGCSVYELQERIVGLAESAQVQTRLRPQQLHVLDSKALAAVADALSDWITMGGPGVEHRLTPWTRAAAQITTAAHAQAALTATRTLASQTLPTAVSQLDHLVITCGLRRPTSVSSWAETLDLLRNVAEVGQAAETTIWSLDLDSALVALRPAARSAVGRAAAAAFDGGYRQARRALTQSLRTPLKGRALHALATQAAATQDRWRSVCSDGGLPRLPGDLAGTTGAYQRLTTELAALGAYVGTTGLTDLDTTEAQRSLDSLIADQDTLFKLPRLHDLARDIDAAGLADVRRIVIERSSDPVEARQLIEYVFCAGALENISLSDSDIGAFDGNTHTMHVAEFVEADRKQISAGAARVRRAVAEHLNEVRNANQQGDALIAAEVRKKRQHRTLRELTQMAPDILLALKPCWAMSPLAVSQLLDARQLFDVVIFDEASQVPPADAVPALMRAKQVIVAGDAKQLPPTAFFASSTLDDDGIDNEDSGFENLAIGMESVLDSMASIVTAGAISLRWHYRSRDERLIAFSNAQPSLYDWQMVTFPGATGHDAIRHVHVPWQPAVGAGDDTSSAEVRRVVELIAEHAYSNPTQSLGVIAMGVKHADRIDEALRRARAEDPTLDSFCESHTSEPTFVKNLERVQGDERDAIILSVGYGKGPDGRMQYRFGPINLTGGERRLNVAITRARSQMTLVSSFQASDLDSARLKSEGAQMLGRYLAYTASRGEDLGHVYRPHPPLNHFEADVRDRLAAAGVPLVPQLGVSGYFIDFAAQHPSRPGEYALAIEADGASYHSSPTARERDRLRQDHLERLGWRFHRIWSTDWFRNPEREVAKALTAWQSACALSDQAHAQGVTAKQQIWGAPDPATSQISIPPAAPVREGVRPIIFSGQPIDFYDDGHLLDIVKWVASDGFLRTDTELLDAVVMVMGYRRRGAKIVARLETAVRKFRTL